MSVLQKLFAETRRGEGPPRIAIVVAHPNDEVLGAGAQLRRWPHAHVVYATAGQDSMAEPSRNSHSGTARSQALGRQRESIAALTLAGFPLDHIHPLEFPAGKASFQLLELTALFAEQFVEIQPEFIVTHAYEGVDPDHDATAFAVHIALGVLHQETGWTPTIVELASYHDRMGTMAATHFLSAPHGWVATLVLTEEERAFKQRLLGCFKTQLDTFRSLRLEVERFRTAPHYDFAQPPHPGRLDYELSDTGMTGECWRHLARQALKQIGKTLIERSTVPAFS